MVIADVNVSPSLEVDGLVFQAAAHSGVSHSGLLRQLISNACRRAVLPELGLLPPPDGPQGTMLAYPAIGEVNPVLSCILHRHNPTSLVDILCVRACQNLESP